MGHMERTGFDSESVLRLAKTGCVVEYDWFGQVIATYPRGRVDVPSDGERIKQIVRLVEEGHGEQVVISQDVCMKMRLASYGGPGYGHVVRYVSEWMCAMGLERRHVDDILLNNPSRILSFA